jgi:hypothetical protein
MVERRARLAAATLTVMLLSGCGSLQERAHTAAVTQGQVQAAKPFPDLPEACTAKTGRVKPTPEEARVVTLKRWEITADLRDRKAEDCRDWGADMKANFR